ncbi:M1 family metallopeptidase [Haoranjiania flava]|uniref:M1 family metallopeptidase n=1 Tax=Haoranjiania flava TaxID=1856322 RepID=A0AAE3IJS4_9BACT|nr:M1 family metallopeptidase [Haoranjiania flava]MCU7693397.1 M1 family metallopeptidase [Haoranjiania flava]
MNRVLLYTTVLLFAALNAHAQTDRWQQKIKYSIDVNLDVKTNIMKGKEVVTYWNNSPDSLDKIFVHLFWNAFQPGSMMDERSNYAGRVILGRDNKGNIIRDWDKRVADRISKLAPDETGYQRIQTVRVNGQVITPEITQTIMKIPLQQYILPGRSAVIEIVFEAQVPLQIRRAGRDNAEGVRYSMAQWYPKIAAYDHEGWHPNQYIAREFYAPFGEFNVNITLDKHYMVAGSGTIINPNEVGYNYGVVKGMPRTNAETLTWKFKANNIHDFVWSADPDYTMIRRKVERGPLLYFVYKKTNEEYDDKWKKLADTIELVYPFIEKTFGPYRYPNYSFIQGADGGMEYPMATLIKGPGVGTALHELGHNWYQGTIASNEGAYAWMDEGGATYFEQRIRGWINRDSMWYLNSYDSYYNLVKSKLEEPMSTHADHFNTNYAYSQAAYGKGMVFYAQLAYIIGNKKMDEFLLEYERQWKFKHPTPADMVRVAEHVSGLQLKWYKDYWVNTTRTIDYAIGDVVAGNNDTTLVELRREGGMPMPVDILVTYKNKARELVSIATDLMFGHKEPENNYYRWSFPPAWNWTNQTYVLKLPTNRANIVSIEIDPSKRLADVEQKNNVWENKR